VGSWDDGLKSWLKVKVKVERVGRVERVERVEKLTEG
jgi:hypothetical protein